MNIVAINFKSQNPFKIIICYKVQLMRAYPKVPVTLAFLRTKKLGNIVEIPNSLFTF